MAMQHREYAGRIDLEHRPRSRNAVTRCSAVKVARRVQNQTCQGIGPVRKPGEAVQHPLCAGRIQLEHHSTSGNDLACSTDDPASGSSAVEVASPVLNQTCYGIGPLRSASEFVKQSESLRLRPLY